MRKPWQCPTCYAELGDKRFAKMLTCPYCGSLLIVDQARKKFLRVNAEKGWVWFKKMDYYGIIVTDDGEERYFYSHNNWYLVFQGDTYSLSSCEKFQEIPLDEKNVSESRVLYIWGEFPFIAPPTSKIKTIKLGDTLIKKFTDETLCFFKVSEK